MNKRFFFIFPLLIFFATPLFGDGEYFISQNSYLEELISEFQANSAKKNWPKALRFFKKIHRWLQDEEKKNPGQNYVHPLGQNRYMGMKKYLFRLYATLPAGAKKLLPFPESGPLFQRAKKLHSTPLLEKLIRKYPFAPEAPKALYLLSSLYLEQGNFIRAFVAMRDLQERYPRHPFPQALLRARKALCLYRIGENQQAESLLKNHPPKGILWKSLLRRTHTPKALPQGRYPGFKERAISLFDRKSARQIQKDFARSKKTLPFPYSACLRGSSLFVQTARGVLAADYQRGDVLWRFNLPTEGAYLERPELAYFKPSVSTDLVFFTFKTQWTLSKRASTAQYRMIAFEKEGKIHWDSGQIPSLSKLFKGAHWVSSPQYAYGRVYFTLTLSKKSFETYLVCLESKKGTLIWKKLLSVSLPPRPFGLSAVSAPPLVRGGRVYVTTNLGVVAVLDSLYGQTQWVYRYQTFPDLSREHFIQRNWFWQIHPGELSRQVYVASPGDSSYLYGFQSETGKLLWRFPWDGMSLLGHSRQGRIFLGGEKGLLCLNVLTGKVIWFRKLPPPAGQWALGKNLIYYPTRQKLFQVEIQTGGLRGFYRWEDPLFEPGNLLFGGNRLLSTSLFQQTVYSGYQLAVNQFKKKGIPSLRNPQAEYGLGKLYFLHGQFDKALSYLERAYRSLGDQKIARYLYKLYRRKGDQFFQKQAYKKVIPLFVKALPFGVSQKERFEILTKLIFCYRKTKNYPKEIFYCRRLFLHYSSRPYPLSGGRWVEAGFYAKKRIGQILSLHGRSLYRSYEQSARARFRAAGQTGTKEGFVEVIHSYPNSQICSRAYQRLAEFYERKSQFRLALKTWKAFVSAFSPSQVRPFLKIYKLSEKLADYEGSLLTLLKIRRKFARQAMAFAPGQTYSDMVRILLKKRVYAKLWPHRSLALPAEKLWQIRTHIQSSLSQKDNPRVYSPKGQRPSSMMNSVFFLYEDRLECRQSQTGILQWEFLADFVRDRPLLGGGFLANVFLFSTRSRVVALDIKNGSLKWSYRFPKDLTAQLSNIQWIALGKKSAFLASQGGKVVCLKGTTGKVAWTKTNLGSSLSQGIIYKNWLVTAIANPAELVALQIRGGKEVFRKKIQVADPRLTQKLQLVDGDKLVLLLAGKNLLTFSLSQRKVLWRKSFPLWIHKLFSLGDRILVSTRQWSTYILCLDPDSGATIWKFQTMKIVPSKIFVDSSHLYIFAGSFRHFEIHAINLERGNRDWKWSAPFGERYETMFSDNKYIFLPYLRETPGKVYCLSKRSGTTTQIIELGGKKILGGSLWNGVLLLLTDRGGFGFGKKSHLSRKIFELELAKKTDTDPKIQQLAALYFQKGEVDQALALLERAIVSGDLSSEREKLFWDQMDGYKENYIESQAKAGKNVFKVHRIYQPVEVDATANDWWLLSEKIPLVGPRYIWPVQRQGHTLGNWVGDDDLKGELYLSWDSKYFYFLLKVEDQILKAYDSEAPLWKGDCLLMALDFDGNGGQRFRRGDTVLSLALQVPKKKNKKQQKADKKKRPKGKYSVKRTPDGRSTIYEVALPWTMFKKGGAFLDPLKGPQPGFVFGLNLVVTDDDGGGQGATKSLNLTPGLILHRKKSKLWYSFVPSHFAKIQLVK